MDASLTHVFHIKVQEPQIDMQAKNTYWFLWEKEESMRNQKERQWQVQQKNSMKEQNYQRKE